MEPDLITQKKNLLRRTQTIRSPSQQNSPKENQQPNIMITPGKSKPQGKKHKSQIKSQNRPNSFSFQNSKEESYKERSPDNDVDDQDIEPNNTTTIRNVPMTRSIISSPPAEKSPAQQKNKQEGKMEQKDSPHGRNQNDSKSNMIKHEPKSQEKPQKSLQQLAQQIYPGAVQKFNQKKAKEKYQESEKKQNQLDKNTISEIKPHSLEVKLQNQSPQKSKSDTQSNLAKSQQKIKYYKAKYVRSPAKSKDDPQRKKDWQETVRRVSQFTGKTFISQSSKNLQQSLKSKQQSSQTKVEPKSQKKIQQESPSRKNNQLSSTKVEQKSSPKSNQQRDNPKVQKKAQQKGSPKSSQQIKPNQSQEKSLKKLQSPNPQKVYNKKSSPTTSQIKSPAKPKDSIKEEQKAQIVAKTPQQKDERLSTPPGRTSSNKSQDKLLFSSGKSQVSNKNKTPNPNEQISLNLGSGGGSHDNSNSSLLLHTSRRRSIDAQEYDIKKRRHQANDYFYQILEAQFHIEYPDVVRMIERELQFIQRAPTTQQQFGHAFPQRLINLETDREGLLQQWKAMVEDYRRDLLGFLDIINEKDLQVKRNYPVRYNVVQQKHQPQLNQQQGEQIVQMVSNKQEKVEEQQNDEDDDDNMAENQNQHHSQKPVPLQENQPNQNLPSANTNEVLIVQNLAIQPKPNEKQGYQNQSNKSPVNKKKGVNLPSNDQQRMPNRHLNKNNNSNANLRNSIRSSRSSNKLSHSNNKREIKKQIQGQRSQKRANKGVQQKQKKTVNQHELQNSIKSAAQRCNDIRDLLSLILVSQQHQYLRDNFNQFLGMLEQIQEGLKISRFQKKLLSKNLKKCKKRIIKLQLSFNQSYDLNLTMSNQMQDQYKKELYQRKVQQLISEQDQDCFEAFQMESLDDYYERHNKFKQPYYSEISDSEDQNMNISFSGQNNMNQHPQSSRQNNLQSSRRNDILQQSFCRNKVQVKPEQDRGNFSFEQQNPLGSYSPSIQGVHGNLLDSPVQGLINSQNSQAGSPHQGSNSNSVRQRTPQLISGSQNMHQRSNSSGGVQSPVFGILKQPPAHLKGSNYNNNKNGTPRQNKNNIRYKYYYESQQMQHEQQNEKIGFSQSKQNKKRNLIKKQNPRAQQQIKENQVENQIENQVENCRCRNKIKITDAIQLVHQLQKMVSSKQVLRINIPIKSIHRQNVQQILLNIFMKQFNDLKEVSFKVYDLAYGNKKRYEKIFEQGRKLAKQSYQLKKLLQDAYDVIDSLKNGRPINQNSERNILSSKRAIKPRNQEKNMMHVKDTMQLLRQLEGFITEGRFGNVALIWQSIATQSIHPQLYNQLKIQFQKTHSSVSSRFYVQQELSSQRFNLMNQLLQKIKQPVRMQENQGQIQRPLYQILKSPVAGRIEQEQIVQMQPQQQMPMRLRNSPGFQAVQQRFKSFQPERQNLRQSRRRQKIQRFKQSRRRLQHRTQPQIVAHQEPADQQNRSNLHPPTCRKCESIEKIAQDRKIFENKLKIKDVNAILQWLLVFMKQYQCQDPANTMRSIMKQKIDQQSLHQFGNLFTEITFIIYENIEIITQQDKQIRHLQNILDEINYNYVMKIKKPLPDQDYCQIILNQAKNPNQLFNQLLISSNNQGQMLAKVLQYRMVTICEFLTTCIPNYPQEIVTEQIKLLQNQDQKIRDKLQESGLPTTDLLDEAIDCFLTQLMISQQISYINDRNNGNN